MAPEQVMGDRPLDGRSDIYAVGCPAYWLVTAQLVFTGRTAIEIMMHHAQTVPMPPSERSEVADLQALRRRDTGVSREESDARPATADTLAAELVSIGMTGWTLEKRLQWWGAHHPATSRVA